MKPRTPLYLTFGSALCVYLALANHNGWSLLHSLSPARFLPSSAATRHK